MFNMIRKNKNLLIISQDKGISATHPIIFKKNEENIAICSISQKKRFNYSIILPTSKIKYWDSKNKEYFLNCINDTNNYIESGAGHDLAMKYGIDESIINTVKKEYYKSENLIEND